MSKFKIGDTVYVFDSNHRVYAEKLPGDGYAHGGPIYREHFRERQIVAETTQSWLVGFPGAKPDAHYLTKHKKKEAKNGLYLLADIEEDVFKHDHAHKIADLIRHADYVTLRKIAELINYQGGK